MYLQEAEQGDKNRINNFIYKPLKNHIELWLYKIIAQRRNVTWDAAGEVIRTLKYPKSLPKTCNLLYFSSYNYRRTIKMK